MEVGDIETAILETPGVCCVHDLHVWSISGDKHALAAHVVLSSPEEDGDKVLSDLNGKLDELFNIRHTTIQIESTHGELDQAPSRSMQTGQPVLRGPNGKERSELAIGRGKPLPMKIAAGGLPSELFKWRSDG